MSASVQGGLAVILVVGCREDSIKVMPGGLEVDDRATAELRSEVPT